MSTEASEERSFDAEIAASQPPWVLRERLFREKFTLDRVLKPEHFYPFFRPCTNRVLLVADSILDFSEADFGLSVFVRTLLDTPGGYVRHQVTLAHIDSASGTRLMSGENRIARRIPQFKFDDPDHFSADMYDVVMLFGFYSSFSGRGTASNGKDYPSNQLADPELEALTAYMNGGGGLFATGDHGALGKALSAAIPRVRNMRLWDSTPAQGDWDEVSMGGPRRNDTNRGTEFDNQSDDIPQVIQPKMYVGGWVLPIRFPHPLLCGPRGVIRTMPDHPHEGECVEPSDLTGTVPGGADEYPAATDGGTRPVPEVISTNTVFPNNTATLPGGAEKAPTVAQVFGGICAYDGHRAGVGRVVTDATWHHFVNVNLVGMAAANVPARFDKGFLGSTQGIGYLEDIRAYFRNLVVWSTRPERIRCMNIRLALGVVFDGRVLEAVLTATDTRLKDLSPLSLRLAGAHARDVLGRTATQCQAFGLVLDLVLERAIPDLIPHIDPWRVDPREKETAPASSWVNGMALVDYALGAALVSLRDAVGEPTEDTDEIDSDRLAEVMAEGGGRGVDLAREGLAADLERVRELFGL
jgi:hypothetical protein